MDKDIVKKASDLLFEIEELQKYKEFKSNKQKHTVHFEIKKHYGNCSSNETIIINRVHTTKLMDVIEEIIIKLELELSELK